MPTLDWIGKKAVVNHHREVPYRLIHCDGELSAGDPDAGNLLVQGDNLEALKALLPYYAGKVKCIYIDPPYNTGKDDWRYSDKVDDPTIKAWLGQAIGPESEDFTRHEKWLCMMYPRLVLLRDFLREDGVIICSIDQNEFAYLRILFDSIFSRRSWVGDLVWKNVTDNNPSRVVMEHEYMLVYANNIGKLPKIWNSSRSDVKAKIELQANELIKNSGGDLKVLQSSYSAWFKTHKAHLWPFQEYDQIDFDGVFTESRSVHNPGKEGYFWDICHPKTGKVTKKPLMGYRFPEETRDLLVSRNEIIFGKDENHIIRLKVPLSRYVSKLPSVMEFDGRRGSNEIREILSEEKRAFANPKPSDMISDILSYVTNDGDLILDSFGGSGTTGHAVWTLDAKLQERRRFILVEMKEDIAQNVTAPRLSRVSQGYQRKKRDGSEEPVHGLGSGFRFCTLGVPLFNEFGDIDPGVTFSDLAAHVFFSETGAPIPHKAKADCRLIGTYREKAVYLLFSAAEQGVAREAAGNVLTPDVLTQLPPVPDDFAGQRVVYGEGCTVSADRLKAESVTFKQIPYQIEAN